MLTMIKCKICGEIKNESQYYVARKYYKGTLHINYFGACKTCCGKRQKQRLLERKEEVKRQRVVKVEELKDDWIIRNLQRFGNCYIKKKDKYDLDKIKAIINKDFDLQPAGDMIGFIIQVRK